MNRLEPLNNYLENQQPRQRIIIYVALVVLILALGYLLYLDDSLTRLSDKTQELEKKELMLKKSVRNSAVARIRALKKKIKQSKENIDKKKQENSNAIPSEKDASLFSINDSNFAMFLESSLAKSRDLNVSLTRVDIFSDKLPYIGYLEIKKRLVLHGEGRFLDILRLSRYMEDQNFLIKLTKFDIKRPNIRKKKLADKKINTLNEKHVIFDSTFEVMGTSL